MTMGTRIERIRCGERMTIRKQPEDFLVRETLASEFLAGVAAAHDTAHRHALLRLAKTSLTTPDACSMLARTLGVKAGAVAYAGLKDKHAKTVQHVSVLVGDDAEGHKILRGLGAAMTDRNWSAELIGFATREVEASDIESNAFEIVVRDLTRQASDEMARRADALFDGEGMTLVNYFGDQRFGGARDGFAAVHLLRGDFEAALKMLIATPHRKDMGKKREFTRLLATHWGDWKRLAREAPNVAEKKAVDELAAGRTFRDAFAALPNFSQQMCVDALQSHVWNGAAREGVRASVPKELVIAAEDPFGEMLFATAQAWELEPLRTWTDLRVPMPSVDATGSDGWMKALAAALREHGLTMDKLVVPGLRRPAFGDAPRLLAVRATGFDMTRAMRDELDASGKRLKRALRFSLPRGAYATVLLRALGQ
jgi:tRNA pseudouridine13 synthase